jgi:hypothetical protein
MHSSIGKETLGRGTSVPGAAADAATQTHRGAVAPARRPHLGHGEGNEDPAWGGRNESMSRSGAAACGWDRIGTDKIANGFISRGSVA